MGAGTSARRTRLAAGAVLVAAVLVVAAGVIFLSYVGLHAGGGG